MSPASAAPPKRAPTNGRQLRARQGSICQCPEADVLVDFIRGQLLDMKDRLGWSYEQLSSKMKPVGRTNLSNRSGRCVEVMLKTGGFPTMVKIAKAMGLRVVVDLK